MGFKVGEYVKIHDRYSHKLISSMILDSRMLNGVQWCLVKMEHGSKWIREDVIARIKEDINASK